VSAHCVTCLIALPFLWLARCEFHVLVYDYPAYVRAYKAENYPETTT
jgi:hypothetical protein